MINVCIARDLAKAASALLALQVAAFWWRIRRELSIGKSGDMTWLPPADLLNLLSILISIVGVFALPTIGALGDGFARVSFGVALILFVGFVLSLPAHYELYTGGHRTYRYFPLQEKVAVTLVLFCACLYVGFSVVR